jgi:hypothetical protein
MEEIEAMKRAFAILGKDLDRAEDVEWNPPVLKFAIERHGGVVLGGKTATVQRYEYNAETGELEQTNEFNEGKRLLEERSPSFTEDMARDLAEKIIGALRTGESHEGIKTLKNGTRKITFQSLFKRDYKQTRLARLKRLKAALDEIMPNWRDNRWPSQNHESS